jgi:hypothetical protein
VILRTTALLAEITAGQVPESAQHAAERIGPLTIGLQMKAPILMAGARLFRARSMDGKPGSISDVGAPPVEVTSIGRLNERGQSVLYLSDSPDTAFQEVRSGPGRYCLSEWRVLPEKLVLINGGIPTHVLKSRFPRDLDPACSIAGGVEDPEVMELFQTIFALLVDGDTRMYRWSIAAGLASGFAHICGRTGTKVINGNTLFLGRFPFSGIAYTSIRSDKQAVNFGFNDLGRTYICLNHVQWTQRYPDGSFSSLDFATSWDADGNISWLGRPARFQIAPGDSARLTKIGETVWSYESIDGTIPEFA